MTLEELLKGIKNTPQLTPQQKRTALIKYQIGNETEKKKAFSSLQKHYLELTLEYVTAYCKAFPNAVNNEDDICDLINEGFVFLSDKLQEYVLVNDKGFENYFKRTLKSHFEYDVIQNQEEEETINNLTNETVSDLTNLFPIYHNHLEEQIASLDSTIQEVLRYRFGYYGKIKCTKEVATRLNIPVRRVDYARKLGVRQLQEKISHEEVKTMLYQYRNQRKVIK